MPFIERRDAFLAAARPFLGASVPVGVGVI
jgi:hypothetical protein